MKKIDDLIPYINNPRKNDGDAVDKVASSIKNFGFKVPIVIDSGNEIVAGHTRYKASQKLGLEEVPCIVADDLNENQIKAFRIADNRVAQEAEWDWDLLSLELSDIKEFDIQDLGFDIGEMPNFEEEKEVIEDIPPEPPENPISKLGDIWLLGRHRLMCGDSTTNDVEKLMDGNKADMVFTDPPYGVSYTGGHNIKKREMIDNDELKGDSLTELFHLSLTNAHNVSKDYSAFYVWYATGKSIEVFESLKYLKLNIRAIIAWYKINSGLGAFMSQYIPNYEPCIYAHKIGKSPQWFGKTDEKTVWELKRQSVNEYHPTQKPIELPSRAIKNSSKNDDIILDLFGGSGSTLIASEQLNRICYMMEIDEKYVDVIVNRYINFKESSEDVYLIRNGKKIKYKEVKHD